MLTTTDIKKLKSIFVSKTELRAAIAPLATKDEVLTRLDAIMGELQAIREEMTIVVYRQSEHTDILENYGQRLVRLEEITQPKRS